MGSGAVAEGLDCDGGRGSPPLSLSQRREQEHHSASPSSSESTPPRLATQTTAALPLPSAGSAHSWNHSWDSSSLAGAFFILQVSARESPPPLRGRLPAVIPRPGTLLTSLAECMDVQNAFMYLECELYEGRHRRSFLFFVPSTEKVLNNPFHSSGCPSQKNEGII